jgi:hypothetical protein
MASNTPTPYIPQNPGDLITAETWNQMQVDVKMDIAAQIQTAVGNIKSVDHATNADQLGGQTPDQLTQAILKLAQEILPKRTGYFRSFLKLEKQKERVVKHNLKSFPLVDVYQLDYFPAICSGGENDDTPRWVNFYLYHENSDRSISAKVGTTTVKAVIEPPDQQPFRVLFSDMLAQYNVDVTDTHTLDQVEQDFWSAFWGNQGDPNRPNDQFDNDQYCHSPWFEKCCGEKRTIKQLQDAGSWNKIWLKMIPRKTINYPTPDAKGQPPFGTQPAVTTGTFDSSVAPTQIQVAHHDFDSVGLKLLADPVYPPPFDGGTTSGGFALPDNYTDQLKVMVLMKV